MKALVYQNLRRNRIPALSTEAVPKTNVREVQIVEINRRGIFGVMELSIGAWPRDYRTIRPTSRA